MIFNFSKNMFSLVELPFKDKLEVVMSLDGKDYLIKIKPINTVKVNIQNLDDPLSISVLDLIMTNTFNFTLVKQVFFYRQFAMGTKFLIRPWSKSPSGPVSVFG